MMTLCVKQHSKYIEPQATINNNANNQPQPFMLLHVVGSKVFANAITCTNITKPPKKTRPGGLACIHRNRASKGAPRTAAQRKYKIPEAWWVQTLVETVAVVLFECVPGKSVTIEIQCPSYMNKHTNRKWFIGRMWGWWGGGRPVWRRCYVNVITLKRCKNAPKRNGEMKW